jgi:lysophospholipase L1-like esterase
MRIVAFILAAVTAVAVMDGAAAAPAAGCDLPGSILSTDSDLTHVAAAIKARHHLDIAVIGSGSSTLPGPDGAQSAYPARLEAALKARLPGVEIAVTAHVKSRQTTTEMAAELSKILADEKPSLVIWQAGTVDAMRGVEPDEFRATLDDGVDTLTSGGADVILMNMQYSPRTESMLGVSAYADVMRWVAQQHGMPLFDRLALMRYWNESGQFDLYAATKDYAMARKVHECIGQGLASQISDAAHLELKKQTTR